MKIKIDINELEHHLTLEDAEKLYYDLKELFEPEGSVNPGKHIEIKDNDPFEATIKNLQNLSPPQKLNKEQSKQLLDEIYADEETNFTADDLIQRLENTPRLTKEECQHLIDATNNY